MTAPRMGLVRRPSPVLIALIAALGFTALSLLWSPYDGPEQALKLIILTSIFLVVPLAAPDLSGRVLFRTRQYAIASTVAGLAFFGFEAATGGLITASFKVDIEGMTDPASLDIFVTRALSRGAFPLILLSLPVARLLWAGGSRALRAAAIAVMALAPWLDTSSVRSGRYRPMFKWWFALLCVDFVVLMWAGAMPAEPPYSTISLIGSTYWFAYFLVILPLLGVIEKPEKAPATIEEDFAAHHAPSQAPAE